MAVLNVKKNWSQKRAEITTDGRSYEESYTILTDSATTSMIDVRNAAGLPTVDVNFFPGDPAAVCRRVSPVSLSPTLWIASVAYSTQAGTFEGSPLDAPPEIEWDGAEYTEDAYNDYDGNPFLNSAGMPYDPQPVIRNDAILIVRRNLLTINYANMQAYRGAVNSDYFFTNPGQARMRKWNAKIIYDGPLTYWQSEWQIQFKEGLSNQPDGSGGAAKAWFVRVLDQGLHENINAVPGAPVSNPDDLRPIYVMGQQVSSPYPLDGAGLAHAGGPNVFHEWRPPGMRILPFSTLGIL